MQLVGRVQEPRVVQEPEQVEAQAGALAGLGQVLVVSLADIGGYLYHLLSTYVNVAVEETGEEAEC